jgi:hypothetical protein
MKNNIVQFNRPVKHSFYFGVVSCEITSYTYGYDLIKLQINDELTNFITDADKSWTYAQYLIGHAIAWEEVYIFPDGIYRLEDFNRL